MPYFRRPGHILEIEKPIIGLSKLPILSFFSRFQYLDLPILHHHSLPFLAFGNMVFSILSRSDSAFLYFGKVRKGGISTSKFKEMYVYVTALNASSLLHPSFLPHPFLLVLLLKCTKNFQLKSTSYIIQSIHTSFKYFTVISFYCLLFSR